MLSVIKEESYLTFREVKISLESSRELFLPLHRASVKCRTPPTALNSHGALYSSRAGCMNEMLHFIYSVPYMERKNPQARYQVSSRLSFSFPLLSASNPQYFGSVATTLF